MDGARTVTTTRVPDANPEPSTTAGDRSRRAAASVTPRHRPLPRARPMAQMTTRRARRAHGRSVTRRMFGFASVVRGVEILRQRGLAEAPDIRGDTACTKRALRLSPVALRSLVRRWPSPRPHPPPVHRGQRTRRRHAPRAAPRSSAAAAARSATRRFDDVLGSAPSARAGARQPHRRDRRRSEDLPDPEPDVTRRSDLFTTFTLRGVGDAHRDLGAEQPELPDGATAATTGSGTW